MGTSTAKAMNQLLNKFLSLFKPAVKNTLIHFCHNHNCKKILLQINPWKSCYVCPEGILEGLYDKFILHQSQRPIIFIKNGKSVSVIKYSDDLFANSDLIIINQDIPRDIFKLCKLITKDSQPDFGS